MQRYLNPNEMRNMNEAIVVDSISKRYGALEAVKSLSFQMADGEILAILGPNGSGKTTTMRMLLDIIKPDTGDIAILGGAMSEALKQRIGYMPEERGLYSREKTLDVMVYLATLKGVPAAEARQRAMELLEQLELAEHAKTKISELSKGMQQKVQFAVTVLHRPALIIIDEPFAGLDPINTQLVKALLLALRREGVAILMSTHMMHSVEEMADRLLMIHEGRRVLYGEVSEIRQRFAPHAIRVNGEGNWAALPGVVRTQGPARNGSYVLHLCEEMSVDEALASIARADHIHLNSFERATPSLNDIFIDIVEGENGATPVDG